MHPMLLYERYYVNEKYLMMSYHGAYGARKWAAGLTSHYSGRRFASIEIGVILRGVHNLG